VIQIIEALIGQGKIQPIAVALVDNIYQNRFVEYACNDGTVIFYYKKCDFRRQVDHAVVGHR
jgi:enterochelin esterase-like enzyme